MAIIDFLLAIAVSLFDPLLMIGYVVAGVFTRSVRQAAMWGFFAGCLVVGTISLLLSDGMSAPHVSISLAQIAACGLGAMIVRGVAARFARRHVEQPAASR